MASTIKKSVFAKLKIILTAAVIFYEQTRNIEAGLTYSDLVVFCDSDTQLQNANSD